MAAVASACAPTEADRPQTETSAVISNRNLDVLFMIDNSASMHLSQANLLRNFPTFMNVLKELPGGLPNIHVAVVSSDMGAGDGMVNALLRHRRQRGVPVRSARDLHVDDAAARRDVHLQRRRDHELRGA